MEDRRCERCGNKSHPLYLPYCEDCWLKKDLGKSYYRKSRKHNRWTGAQDSRKDVKVGTGWVRVN